MKKCLSALCTILFLVLTVPVFTAFAETASIDISHSDIAAELGKLGLSAQNTTTLNVTGKMKPRDYKYVMETLTNLKTLHLADETEIPTKAFYDYEKDSGHPSLQLVTAPKVRTVGTRAFYKCPNLYRVQMNEMTDIDMQAFAECTRLRTVSIPSCITIGEAAFDGCKSLTSLNAKSAVSIENDAFRNNVKLVNPDISSVSCIMDRSFFNCDSLTELTVNASEIGIDAFADCDSLVSFSAPHAANIKSGALANCKALTEVDLSSVIKVGSGAFENDAALNALTIGKYVPDFDSAWHNCFKGTTNQLKIYTEAQYTEEQRGRLIEFVKESGGAELPLTSISVIVSADKTEEMSLEDGQVAVDAPSIDLDDLLEKENTVADNWDTSDASVVSVDGNGIVTAQKEGTATITGTVADESGNSGKKEVELKVVVTNNGGTLSMVIEKVAEKAVDKIIEQVQQTVSERVETPATADLAFIILFLCIFVGLVSYFSIEFEDKADEFIKSIAKRFKSVQ